MLHHQHITFQSQGAMDFDDLLLKTNELLTRFPSIVFQALM